MIKFEIYRDRSKQRLWRWRAKSHNGNVVAASSQGYSRRARCMDMLKRYVHQIHCGLHKELVVIVEGGLVYALSVPSSNDTLTTNTGNAFTLGDFKVTSP